jgi:hypothetical protein
MPQQGGVEGGAGEENEFNDFEEDETTKRIREEEERIQNTLKEKSVRTHPRRTGSGRKRLHARPTGNASWRSFWPARSRRRPNGLPRTSGRSPSARRNWPSSMSRPAGVRS